MKVPTRPIVTFALFGLVIVTMATFVAPQTPVRSTKQAPGFYRGYVGSFEVVALSDGTAPRHLDQILSDPRVVDDELGADHESQPVPLSIDNHVIAPACCANASTLNV